MSRNALVCVICIFMLTSYSYAGEANGNILENAKLLRLRSAVARGIERNLDLKMEELNIPIGHENTVMNEADFDPTFDVSIYSLEDETPSASAFTENGLDVYRETGGTMGIGKRFHFGLESKLSYETLRSMNNSSIDALRPQYRSFLIFNLTQPLLRDLGSSVNTTDLRISQNEAQQAFEGFTNEAQIIAEEIELAYYDLTEAVFIYRYFLESRKLALELFQGNRKKFEAGIVPITEVQEAETAVASRDEEVVLARQEIETSSNRLKDLLEIRRGDPLYEELFITERIRGGEQAYPKLEKAFVLALENRPDIKLNHLQIEKLDIRLKFYKNQKLPRLDLEATLGANGLSGGDRPISFSDLSASSSWDGGYFDSLSRMADTDGYEWFLGLRYSYVLGNRAAKSRYRIADKKKRQAIYQLKRLEGKVETEVKNSMIVIERSLERIKVSKRFEGLAETTLKQEMERLREGLSDTFRILDFQDDLIEARIRKVKALMDFNRGLASLFRAMGKNLDRFNIITECRTQ
ncbi:MAG: TolC family protein [Thermodesulfobacteriota bacterium]|nr:TolC family protein [Thermodesulfobacteriota bacterium]